MHFSLCCFFLFHMQLEVIKHNKTLHAQVLEVLEEVKKRERSGRSVSVCPFHHHFVFSRS